MISLRCMLGRHAWLGPWGATDAAGAHGQASACARCGTARFEPDAIAASALTWSCMVCGDRRPDAQIDVHSEISMIGRIECRSNVRYCNDRAACIAGAPAIAQQRNEAIARSHRETFGG